jgi:5-methyltetrahydropteroyltriglutamate--homocysteine methyltransferase
LDVGNHLTNRLILYLLQLRLTESPLAQRSLASMRLVMTKQRYLPLEQLAVSPQCGFLSSLRGNLLTEDEQFRKLMLEVARKVWNGQV